MYSPSYLPSFDFGSNSWWGIQITEFLIIGQPVTFLRLYPNTFLSTMLSDTLSLPSSLNAKVKVSYPHTYINQQDTQNSWDQPLFFQYTLYMFRTVSVHLQEQSLYKLYVVFGIYGCWVAIATQQPDVSEYTKHDIQLVKRLFLKMDWYSSKHVERILKN